MPTADELLSAAEVRRLKAVLARTSPLPRTWSRVAASARSLGPLGLSDRARAVRDALLADIDGTYGDLAAVVRAALPDAAFTGWMTWPVGEAVATAATASGSTGSGSTGAGSAGSKGAGAEFEDGLALLAELTSRLTGEFALRTFLNADPDRTLAAVAGWTSSPDSHVRRLASEGTRPRLPWASRVPAISERPSLTVGILDRLYADPSEVVRRSVANHLNDISRLDSELALTTAERWSGSPAATTPALVRHSMRTLVKGGEPRALALLGFAGDPGDLTVNGPVLTAATVAEGGELAFTLDITNTGVRPVRLAIDYVVHYRKANGQAVPKVFKLTTRELAPGERTEITRRHSFKPISTRRHYPGAHALELQINGARHGWAAFELTSVGVPSAAS